MTLLCGEDIDRRLNWPLGRSERLAKKGRLPHIVLPDGAIRFEWERIEPLLQHVPAPDEAKGGGIMKLDASDVSELCPLIRTVVADVLAELRESDRQLNGRVGYTEQQAAEAMGIERHCLRDARLRGEIRARKVGKRFVYSRDSLVAFLQEGQST